MNKLLPPQNRMNYDVFSGNLSLLPIFHRTIVINTINQYSYCMAEQNEDFKKALQESDILLPDGLGIVAAEKILNGRKINKITGTDLHQYLLEQLNAEGGSCFYMGASESTLVKIKNRLSVEYPNIKVGTYSPPFKLEFDEVDNQHMLAAVNAFKPDVLFIGMTAPKQEKWAYIHKNDLDAKFICSIGAVFDFYAGTIDRPHRLFVQLGLEWMGRLLKEPKRMWKRYLYYGPVFIYMIIKEKIMQELAFIKQLNLPNEDGAGMR